MVSPRNTPASLLGSGASIKKRLEMECIEEDEDDLKESFLENTDRTSYPIAGNNHVSGNFEGVN